MFSKFRKKFLTIAGVLALLIMVTIASPSIAQLLDNNKLPPHLRLKADKSHIIGTLRKNNGDIKYAYRTDQHVPTTPSLNVINKAQKHGYQILGENVSKRTKNSKTFNTSDAKTFISEFVAGDPQYYQDLNEEWFQVEYATTTGDAFDAQTSPNPISRIFVPSARAATTTSTFYPDPHTESTSIDGRLIHQGTNLTWAQIQGGTGTTYVDNEMENDAVLIASGYSSGGWNNINRAVYLFDTSSIPDTDNIDSATLSLYCYLKTDGLGIAPNINIYSSAPASNTSLTASDYQSLGSTAFSHAIAYASISTSAYNDFALNGAGLAHINSIGISKFGMRNTNYDASNIEPTWSASRTSEIACQYAENSGTTKDPKLVIVHVSQPEPFFPILKARKSTNETWPSTTLQPDDDLKLLLEANKTYEIRGTIFAGSTSAVPDIKLQFGSMIDAEIDIGYITDTEDQLLTGTGTTTTSNAVTLHTSVKSIQFSGTIKMGALQGPFRLWWAQNQSSASNPVSVGRGSYMYAQEL